MNFWDEQVLPRATEWVMRDSLTQGWRRPVCQPARGTVLEFGFAAGANLRHYSASVTSVLAVEPSLVAWQRSAAAREEFARPVELVSVDAAVLELDDGSVDTVVSTWTLCTIPDLSTALAHARRVLREGGQMHVVEHSIPDDPRGRRLARAVQPVWGRLAGGCHLDRDLPAIIAEAGGRFHPHSDSRFLTGTITF